MSSFWSPSRGPTSQIDQITHEPPPPAYSGAGKLHATRPRDPLIPAHPSSGWVCKMAEREALVTNAVRAQRRAARGDPRRHAAAGLAPARRAARRAAAARRARRSARRCILLAREGLVDIEPRRGAVVRPVRRRRPADLYDVRALIEPYAARRAATRIGAPDVARLTELCDLADARGAADDAAVEDQMALNEEFHRIIVAAAGSPRLEAALRAVAGIPRAFRAAFWHDDAPARAVAVLPPPDRPRARAPPAAARRGGDAHAHHRGGRVPHGGDR